ncbi:3D domain-containing protein [Clostridium butyricum]|jgi:3D (Asp-Asp-Asp) domain-containing protein|uniref:3D domain-containing protein n=1 Tax=Clostridium butyricum TaxID=1492 RepID=UPI0020531677|nr:3D domain-containing protein [Clostridium butyricum]MDB2160136.1 3D domain-containing protein [Clostridium butyricum]DAQ97505.1 MAG TPA: 3D containing protein [Caudoviricetes sp.]
MLNRIVKGILIASLLIFPQTNTVNGFAIEYDKDLKEKDIKAINDLKIHEDKPFGLHKGYNNLQAKIEEHKKIQEAVQRRLEEIKRREEEQKRLEEEQKNKYDIDLVLTYYSRHPSENGGYNCTASGSPLREGIVANNFYPLGTKIELEDGRILEVADRGGASHFNNWHRLDVFVDTYDQDYVRSLGVTKIKGRILK